MTDGSAGAESYVAIIELSAEISRAWNGDAFTAAVAMVYVGMDTMALLSCPLGQAKQTRSDFMAWVNAYLRADGPVGSCVARTPLSSQRPCRSDRRRGTSPDAPLVEAMKAAP